MTRPNSYAMGAAGITAVIAAAVLLLLWLNGNGHPGSVPGWMRGKSDSLIAAALIVIALPGPLLMSAVFRDHVTFATVTGSLLNFVFYWLLFRSLIFIAKSSQRMVQRWRT